MRILVLTNSAWDDTYSSGNTLSNWFEGWEDTTYYNIYTRENLPNNNCCSSYLSISPLNIIKNIFRPWRIGNLISNENRNEHSYKSNALEATTVNHLKGFKKLIVQLLVDFLYATGLWMNKRTKSFIKEANPDIVFLFSMSDAFRMVALGYIKKNTNAKIVQFIADDMFGAYSDKYDLLNSLYKMRFPKLLGMADKIYGASPQLCASYQQLFNTKITPLYKGCSLNPPKTTINNPLQIVYAGNLRFGREITLSKLASALAEINKDGVKVKLSIYTNSFINDCTKNLVDIPGTSSLCGTLPYSEIKEKLKQADLVVHVESYEENQKKIVRYSFSTKIIDCLQSGTTLLVIGPKGIASVEYTRNIPGAVVIDDEKNILEILNKVVFNPLTLINKAISINKYAKENHSISVVRTRLQSDFTALI